MYLVCICNDNRSTALLLPVVLLLTLLAHENKVTVAAMYSNVLDYEYFYYCCVDCRTRRMLHDFDTTVLPLSYYWLRQTAAAIIGTGSCSIVVGRTWYVIYIICTPRITRITLINYVMGPNTAAS